MRFIDCALASLLLAVPVIGCSAQRTYEQELAETPPAGQHAVHTERLLRVMRGLDRLTEDRPPQEMDLEAASEPWVAELVEIAQAVADSAEQIPQAAWSDGSLTNPERADFHRRAAALREIALEITRDAEDMVPEQRAQAAADLRAACDGCHSEFRGPREAGP